MNRCAPADAYTSASDKFCSRSPAAAVVLAPDPSFGEPAMSTIGIVESLWRYPVKSMRGEEMDEMFAGYAGIYGDRLFAFESSASPKAFPFLTAREQNRMLRYRPQFRQPEKAARPVNQAEAEGMGAGVNPVSANPAELMIDVQTPDGDTIAIDDPALMDMLGAGVDGKHQLTLLRSDRA